MRAAVAARPEWLAGVPVDRRLPAGRLAAVGCGTSFHAAQTTGRGHDALEFLLDPPEADVLVTRQPRGRDAADARGRNVFAGPKWLVTGRRDSPLAAVCDEVVVATPEPSRATATPRPTPVPSRRWRHCAARTSRGSARPSQRRSPPSRCRSLSTGVSWSPAPAATGRPPRRRSARLREGVHVAAEAHLLEAAARPSGGGRRRHPLLVLEGEGRAVERAAETAAALQALGCDVTLVPTSHPVVDIVPFQRLTLDLADARGIDPDAIRRDEPLAEPLGTPTPEAVHHGRRPRPPAAPPPAWD